MALEQAADPLPSPWSWRAFFSLVAPACVLGSIGLGPSMGEAALLGCGIGLAALAVGAQLLGTMRLGRDSS